MIWWLKWLEGVDWVKGEWFWRVTNKLRADKFWMWLAWKLPRPLVRWVGIRIGAHATSGPWSGVNVPELKMMDALRRWDLTGEKAALDARCAAEGVSLSGFKSETPTPPVGRIIIPGHRFGSPYDS